MMHVNSALMADPPEAVNATVFQKTLASTTGTSASRIPGRDGPRPAPGQAPGRACSRRRSRGSPKPGPRGDRRPQRRLVPDDRGSARPGQPHLARLVRPRSSWTGKPNNVGAHKRLVEAMATAMRRAGYPMIQTRRFGLDADAHQCGTAAVRRRSRDVGAGPALPEPRRPEPVRHGRLVPPVVGCPEPGADRSPRRRCGSRTRRRSTDAMSAGPVRVVAHRPEHVGGSR